MNNRIQLRAGFTLVELLLVMAIIAVLASLSLAVVNDAQQDAHANATRSRITLANSILLQKLDSYSRRRAPINLGVIFGGNRFLQREYRRRTIADIINVEMPRRFQNVAYPAAGVMLSTMRESIYPSQDFMRGVRLHTDLSSGEMDGLVDACVDEEATAFSSRFALNADPVNSSATYPENGASFSVADITFDFSRPENFPSLAARTTVSEYLYTIFETSNFNGVSAIEALGERSFGDTDGDGFLEFIDSWGNPIFFQFEIDLDGDNVTDEYDLNPGLRDSARPNSPSLLLNKGIAVSQIQVRLISSGNNFEIITN